MGADRGTDRDDEVRRYIGTRRKSSEVLGHYFPRGMDGLVSNKDFAIKALVIGAILIVFYLMFSPYRDCMKESGRAGPASALRCAEATSW